MHLNKALSLNYFNDIKFKSILKKNNYLNEIKVDVKVYLNSLKSKKPILTNKKLLIKVYNFFKKSNQNSSFNLFNNFLIGTLVPIERTRYTKLFKKQLKKYKLSIHTNLRIDLQCKSRSSFTNRENVKRIYLSSFI